MTTETEKPVIRVAVIGAGASGLVQTQQLLEAWSREAVKTKLEVVVFEAREDVGGVWLSEGGRCILLPDSLQDIIPDVRRFANQYPSSYNGFQRI